MARLNFNISESAYNRLIEFCDFSGRPISDVVRQVIVEFIDDHRSIRGSLLIKGKFNRTNVILSPKLLNVLDQKIESLGLIGATRGDIISNLVSGYLGGRGVQEKHVDVDVLSMYKEAISKVVAAFKENNQVLLRDAIQLAEDLLLQEAHTSGCQQ